MVRRDHVPTSKITMHKKNAFSHRAHNWLPEFWLRSPMRSDFPVGFMLFLQTHHPPNADPRRHPGIPAIVVHQAQFGPPPPAEHGSSREPLPIGRTSPPAP